MERGDNSEIAAVNNYYANAGYQVATINYRLAPKFHSPAPQEDLHAAFAWLRTHATELKIDTNNFVLTGRSAGAQIVLTMAYTGNEHGVKGVAAFYGPTDMLWSYKYPDNPLIMDSRAVERDFLGGSPTEVYQKYVAESAMFHVNPQTVPTMLLHGMNDAHVWYQQSERLEKILNDNKVKNMVVLFPWATHGCEYNLNGPAGQLSIYAVERFFYALTQM
jgi:acetyl esterase/lipase